MIKNCRVLINNEAVTVINYDGVEVQLPSIKREADFVKVIKKNGNYIVVDDNYKEDTIQSIEKPKKANKKTTGKESVSKNIENELIDEDNENA